MRLCEDNEELAPKDKSRKAQKCRNESDILHGNLQMRKENGRQNDEKHGKKEVQEIVKVRWSMDCKVRLMREYVCFFNMCCFNAVVVKLGTRMYTLKPGECRKVKGYLGERRGGVPFSYVQF